MNNPFDFIPLVSLEATCITACLGASFNDQRFSWARNAWADCNEVKRCCKDPKNFEEYGAPKGPVRDDRDV